MFFVFCVLMFVLRQRFIGISLFKKIKDKALENTSKYVVTVLCFVIKFLL